MKPLLDKEQICIGHEIIKCCKCFLIPYLFYSYISIIPKLVFSSFMYLPFKKSQLWEILLGKSPSGSLWYIWTLSVINISFLLISRIVKSRDVWLIVSIMFFFCVVICIVIIWAEDAVFLKLLTAKWVQLWYLSYKPLCVGCNKSVSI